MSAAVAARVAIGMRIEVADLYQDLSTDSGMVPIDDCVEFVSLCGFALLDPMEGSDWDTAVVAWSSAEVSADNAICRLDVTAKTLNKARAALREKLEPRGLWDESQFGVWLVLYYGDIWHEHWKAWKAARAVEGCNLP